MSFWRIGKWRGVEPDDRPPPSVGEDLRLYAIGDIHGRLDLLDRLLRLIAMDDAVRGPMPSHILFLGDLLDRGPASRQVVDRVRTMMAEGGNAQCLKGNHEELFAMAAHGDIRVIPVFRRAGGMQTLASYGLDPLEAEAMEDHEVAAWMLAHIPRPDVDFIEALPDYLEVGDYLFVHAGIRPGVPIADQVPADLRWIRREFLSHERAHPKMIVHGHSITPEVDEHANRIGIDTGAYFSNRLTAIGLQGNERWYIQTETR